MDTIQEKQLLRYQGKSGRQPKMEEVIRKRASNKVKKTLKRATGRPQHSLITTGYQGRTLGGLRNQHIREKALNHQDNFQGNQQLVEGYLFKQKMESTEQCLELAEKWKNSFDDLGNMFGGLKVENKDIVMNKGEKSMEVSEGEWGNVVDALQKWSTKL
ncbi:hypothetical protein WAI453_007120 [Rhynchosporium graminicola]|uniref:Uncharacterized protein n=1 Tax=Rhynchosporium graminicola TaxID=2792576 RepID=A0A1E1LHG2_9HELO|nr:uncharacterized protein RCO7_02253 [Rhynchosporium commune]